MKFKRLLQKELAPIVRPILQITHQSIGIYDTTEELLLGTDHPGADHHPIEWDGELVGWLRGREQVTLVAELLSELLVQVTERKQLANEVLDRYREINLLYTIAERLTTRRELHGVVGLALEEAQRLIPATSGAVFLLNAETNVLHRISDAAEGQDDLNPAQSIPVGEGLEGCVAQTGKAELVNDLPADPRHPIYQTLNPAVQSLLCAPLKAQERMIGVISIYHTELVNYTAGDLKLLTAIALQSVSAIESALFYQKQLEAARLREEKLQAQLAALRVEIDQTKRKQQVAEITETDFFKQLEQMRRQAEAHASRRQT